MKNKLIASLAGFVLLAGTLPAQVPQLINYQGRVVVNNVNFDGTGLFKFALVDGGTNISHQAAATATVTSGFVTSISITDGGSGYTAVPSVEIIGGGGSGALVTANMSGGVVTGIAVKNPGSGYLSTPDVVIAAPPTTIAYVTYWSNDGTSNAGSEPTAVVSLPVSKGLYSVLLGDTSLTGMIAVPATVFNNPDVRLRVWFNDGVNGSQQLTPDQRLASVGYAMMAGDVPDGAVSSDKIATAAIGDLQVGMLSQFKIADLSSDLAGKSPASHAHAASDLTSGIFPDTLLSSNVALRNTSNTFISAQTINGNLAAYTVDTGQGPNELYGMNQDVLTTSNPTFTTLNTGHGQNELHAMNQNVRSLDSPAFAGLTTSTGGLLDVRGDLKVLESFGDTYYGTLDVGDLIDNATYTFRGPSGTVMTTQNGGDGSGFDADSIDGMHGSTFFGTFAALVHSHYASDIESGTLSDARLSSNVALCNQSNTFTTNQTISSSLRVNTWIGVGRNATANKLEVEGEASKSAAGDWLANSDRRIKQDVRTINGALDTLDKVRLVDFRYTDSYRSAHPSIDDRRYLNVIAQEFAAVFPDHVKPSGELLPDGSAILQVDTYPLTIYSAAAVRELHAVTNALQKENVDLKARVEALEAWLTDTPVQNLTPADTPVQNLADKQVPEKTP